MVDARLTHITLNSGHISRSQREDTHPDVLDALLPVIDADGGPIPSLDGWYLGFMRPRTEGNAPQDGAAFFQFAEEPGLSKRPVVMAMTCWLPAMSFGAWQMVAGSYAALEPALQPLGLWHPMSTIAPATPWLAVFLTPFVTLADSETAKGFGDLERGIAWALMI